MRKKSENDLEKELIQKLENMGYEYRHDIRDNTSLEKNFREQFEALNNEKLNKVKLTDNEFEHLIKEIISSDIYSVSKKLRQTQTLERDDGSLLHYSLLNNRDWCKNKYQVINQFRHDTAKITCKHSFQRYDVIILINGIPAVQIELKASEINVRSAMQQIINYKKEQIKNNNQTKEQIKNDDQTLLCFLQIFVVSNGHSTWYFANNGDKHFNFDADEKYLPCYQFADCENKKIHFLDDFAEKFLAKCSLGKMIIRYIVLLETEQKLIIMRPYQINAVEAIESCIHQNSGNGYIWHTTGSGKTLTSFKASTLLKENPDIEKCLFVVDRKDLDRQTRQEFNKFQENCVEQNTNIQSLVNKLISKNYDDKVIVTTIQKLGLALKNSSKYREQLKNLKDKRIIFIFDECHRSQFGEYHQAIKEFFPNAQLFGFTGTPIFKDNAIYEKISTNEEGSHKSKLTTQDVFHHELHTYTIADAINDGNVLKFYVEHLKPETENIGKRTEFSRKKSIVDSILKKHHSYTANRKFNAIFAVSSINCAIEYQKIFKEIQLKRTEEDQNFRSLNIASIFSPSTSSNPEVKEIQEDLLQEKEDNKQEPEEKREALKNIIHDYNHFFKTNFSIDAFDGYYQDIQQRIKHQQFSDIPRGLKIDIIIVVDMLLTGFDSKFLNTLYVDKKLKHHGLIQAFSRTNRILNNTKPQGNIIDFLQQSDQVNEAIKMFSGLKIEQPNEIWLVEGPDEMIIKFEHSVNTLQHFMSSEGCCKPDEVHNLKGDSAKIKFINLFQEVQRLKIRLDQYTDLTPENKKAINQIIEPDTLCGFRGVYIDQAKNFRDQKRISALAGEEISSELQDLDCELVIFASSIIDYDYIMRLISELSSEVVRRKMTREQCDDHFKREIFQYSNLIDEHDDWKKFFMEEIEQILKSGTPLNTDEVRERFKQFQNEKDNTDLAELSKKYDLNPESLQQFFNSTLARSRFDTDHFKELFADRTLYNKLKNLIKWKKRSELEVELIPLFKKRCKGQTISGLFDNN